jgi:hypothetical protein
MRKEHFGSAAFNEFYDVVVCALSNECNDFVLAGNINRNLADKGAWVFGAPPVEVVSTFTPVTALPFAENVRFPFIVVDMEIEADGYLPADFWLPIDEVFAARLGRRMERASGSALKSRTIKKDAGVFVTSRDPLTMVFMDGPPELCSDSLELPFVIT